MPCVATDAPTAAPSQAPTPTPTTVNPTKAPSLAPTALATPFPTYAPPPPEAPFVPLYDGPARCGPEVAVFGQEIFPNGRRLAEEEAAARRELQGQTDLDACHAGAYVSLYNEGLKASHDNLLTRFLPFCPIRNDDSMQAHL